MGIDPPTTVEFSSTITQQCVRISILEDDIVEYNESFSVHINTSDPAVCIDIAYAYITILEDDDSKLCCCRQ